MKIDENAMKFKYKFGITKKFTFLVLKLACCTIFPSLADMLTMTRG